MTQQELDITNYIKGRCKGKQNAETFSHLSLILGIEERELRNTVAELITNYQIPIGSSQTGYFYIDNDDDYRLAHREIISRIKKLSK